MSDDLNSVVVTKKPDGSWQAHHVPSDRYAFGAAAEEAEKDPFGHLVYSINE